MAFHHGKGSAFKIDNTAGTLTDISSNVNTAELARSIELGETTNFGDNQKSYIVGLQDGTISIGGQWDESTGGVDATLAGGAEPASRTFEYGPEGDSSGDIKYSGECILTNYTVNNVVGDVVSWSADLQITGAVTRGTFT